MNNIVVITYDHPHRKTQDVVAGLKAKGYQKVTLLALPFVIRNNPFKPFYQHRPNEAKPIQPLALARDFGYECTLVDNSTIAKHIKQINPTAILIAGAGLLPAELVQTFDIINSHPAYLPDVRGLDALKWAIYHQKKIGVTSHIINEKADAGRLINRTEVPVYKNDCFQDLAKRQYETEILYLIEAVKLIQNKNNFPPLEEKGIVNKRMPKNIEVNLMQYFKAYRDKFGIEKNLV